MKKIILFSGLILASMVTFAQSDKAVTFGVKGGVNFATLPYTGVDASTNISASNLTSFHAGIFADFKVCGSTSIQPALLYTGKGSKNAGHTSSNGFTNIYQSKTNIYYMQLPVNVIYHLPVGGHNFFVGAGPFLSYGLSGKESAFVAQEYQGELTTSSTTGDIIFGNNDDSSYKRWDYGVGALAGFKFSNGFSINVNYDLGLANIIPDNEYNTLKAKTRVLGISAGFSW